jgi:triacylglycerol lipase
MLAHLQKFLAFILLTLTLAWAAYFVSVGRPAWAWASALLILLGYALFLGIEFVILYVVQTAEPAMRASVLQLLRAWWGEVINAPTVFFWRQPFRSHAEPDNLASGAYGQPGVVLVHGFFCNRGFWNPWMRELRARRVPFVAVNLEPVFGSIDHYPRVIEAAVARLETATAMPVLLVGHSMGGLAIRAWLAQFSADARVRRVITIGSPHQGTWLARYGHTTNGRQMRLGSSWLTELATNESSNRRATFICFFGHCDNIVIPAASGTLAGAENRHVPATAHVHMAFQKVVFDEVWRWLRPGVVPAEVRRDAEALAQ